MLTERELEQKSETRKQAAFDHWLSEPMVRMGISMIPAGERSDALKMLLRSAFDAGFGAGCAEIGITIMTAMLEQNAKDQGPR